jgi:hypothetical protein
MPHIIDFSKLENVKSMEINPIGWITPILVEYGLINDPNTYGGIRSYCWRVKGTTHTFVIPVVRIDFLSAGDYKKHFEDALESFREDYLSWKEEGFITDWSREYYEQYSRFIII